MKRLSLLISGLLLIALLSNCNTTKKTDASATINNISVEQNQSAESIEKDSSIAADSVNKTLASKQASTSTSTSQKSGVTSTQSSGSANINSSSTKTNGQNHVIEHGSNHQSTLDSIKNAKAKAKK